MEVWNDERVTALVRETMSEQQVLDRIERWRRHRTEYGCATEIFLDRSTGLPVGWGGVQHSTIGTGEHLTIGYAIAPDVWGRGYGTEVALAGVACAFDHLGAREVRASILSTNSRSRRVAERTGLLLECEVAHAEGVEAIYVIDRARWSRAERP